MQSTNSPTCAATKTARSIAKDAAQADNFEQRQKIIKFALASERSSGISNMLTEAKAIWPVESYPDEFDKNLWLLNCVNGTIDLKTSELLPHDPEHMLTKLCPVKYDPKASLPMWDMFC